MEIWSMDGGESIHIWKKKKKKKKSPLLQMSAYPVPVSFVCVWERHWTKFAHTSRKCNCRGGINTEDAVCFWGFVTFLTFLFHSLRYPFISTYSFTLNVADFSFFFFFYMFSGFFFIYLKHFSTKNLYCQNWDLRGWESSCWWYGWGSVQRPLGISFLYSFNRK